MPVPWLGPILLGVVSVPDVDRAAAAYRAGLDFVQIDAGRIDPATAARWRAPGVADARYAVLAPSSRVGGAVQLVETPPSPPGYAPLRTHGWAALELAVADVDVALAGLTGDFTVLGEPRPLTGAAAPALRAAQVAGPAGEVLYLTEIRGELPPFALPRSPVSGADGLYVAVLAVRDLVRTRAWWEDMFPVRRCSDRRAAISVLNRAFDLPATRTHRLSSLQLSGRAVVEIDEYPEAAESRPMPTGLLPPGVALVVLGAPVPPGRPRVLMTPERAMLELRSAPQPIDVVTWPT